MFRPIPCILAFHVLLASALAQTPRDFAIDLKADVAATPPHITLSWSLRLSANISAQVVHRRLKGSPAWVQQAALTTTDTSWADATALPGTEYEYWMQRTYTGISPNTAIGYITAGYSLPPVESRGKLLLVVDDTMAGPLAPEIEQLKQDLVSDGWIVQTIVAARTDTAINTKALIKAAYDADPANAKQVYVLGHVPVPYAGNQAPDGHGDHSGAWSADGFYGDMDGAWTDTTVNNTTGSSTRTHNIPGDGKLDQSSLPSPMELMVGRVDLANMQRSPATAAAETSLLRRYLRKAHDFKMKQGAYANIERRVLIRDGFGQFGSESFMRTGWEWGFTTVGRPPEVTFDEAPSGNWWSLAAANTYLMANGNGGGSYETCGSVGATADFGRRPFRAVFTTLFGSYFGDWDSTNNFLRAPLAGNATGDSLGLCCFWAGRPSWFMHHMATGETLGFSARQSMNSQFSAVSNPVYSPINFPSNGTHCGLMGDPSLRMHMVEPPRNLIASSASGTVNLAWSPSSEPNLLGYHVYRAATAESPFTRLTASPLSSPSHSDATGSPSTAYTYMVRTLKNETSPGGTYQNLSLGSLATITVDPDASSIPLNPTSLAVVHNSSVNAQLSWLDNAGDETGFRVERKGGAGGSFTTLANLGAGATSHTDTGPFANNEMYYYRVFAVSAAGDSIPSNEASFEAIPGFFEFDDTLAKVSKTAGTTSLQVTRFGGRNGPASVNFATSNTSAIAGTHYTSTSSALNWADGETGVKLVSVPVTNTGSPQHPKQFRVTLSSPSAGTGIGTYNAISVLIEDPTATLTAPWTQAIIGSITSSSLSVDAEGGISSTTIGGSGLTTAAGSEAGQFAYQTRSGDGVLTALVTAANPAQSGARYAVMIRESTAGGAMMACTSTSSNTSEGTKMASRSTTSGTAVFTGAVTAQVVPRWLRISRAGNSFTSESSADGVTWNIHGSANVPMAATAQWGLFHHSDDRSGTTYSGNFQVAPFQNVAFSAISGPGAPGSLAFTQPAPNRVALTWTAGALAAGYRVEKRSESGVFTQIVDLPAGTLTFTDDYAAPDTGYEYRIIAFNATGNSPPSNTVRVTAPPDDVLVHLPGGVAANADATVKAESADVNFGNETVLPVAGNSAIGSVTACAKTYFRFDLTGIPTVKTATLRLAVADVKNISMTGLNYSASLRFFPDSADGWDESTITWNNAPLNNTATNGFLAGSTLVSTLTINSSSVPIPGAIIGLDASAAQINAGRGADNLVTYAMNTTTPAASVEFASDEHPSLPPPSLEIIHASPLPVRPSFFTVTLGTGPSLDLAWMDNTSTETGFEIQRRAAGGVFALLQNAAANTVSFNDAATVNGTTYEYRVRALSASGNSAWTPIVAATAGGSTGELPGLAPGFASWMLSSDLGSESDNGPEGDSDGDGTLNLIEYAFGTPPNISGRDMFIPGEALIDGERFLTLTFQRRTNVTDVTLAIEASDDLSGPWSFIDPLQPENQTEALADQPALGWQIITVKDSKPVSESGRRFMRLRVTQK